MQTITNSEMKAFRRCHRLHHYLYNLGYRAVADVKALRFGSLFHVGQEAWWRTLGDRLDAALASMATAAVDMDPFERVDAEELMRGYHFRWRNEPLLTLAVEEEFSAPLVNPDTGRASQTFVLGGVIDAVVSDEQARKLNVEHKSSSEDITPGSPYWARLRMDSQVSVYFPGAEALGHKVSACLYDVVKKPTIQPYKATPMESRKYTAPKFKACPACKLKTSPPAPHDVVLGEDASGYRVTCEPDPEKPGVRRVCTDPGGKLYSNLRDADETPDEYRARLRDDIASNPDKYYQRSEVVRLEEELHEHAANTWDTARLIREAQLLNRHPQNPDACFAYHRECDFFKVCTKQASLDDPALYERIENVHRELKAPTTPAAGERP